MRMSNFWDGLDRTFKQRKILNSIEQQTFRNNSLTFKICATGSHNTFTLIFGRR
jgi:hypothetical protein